MTLRLFGHRFSSYTQKALMALYENATPFDFVGLDHTRPESYAEFRTLWPIGKFPLLADGDRLVFESTTIIEYLDGRYPEPTRLIPADPDLALEARMLDRIFDNHVMNVHGVFIQNSFKPPERRDPEAVTAARAALDIAYAWLDMRLTGREWAVGDIFTLADCAAAPALFYADWAHPIDPRFGALKAYRARLLARPSFARCVEDARQYRHFYPLGAPDRD